MTAPEHDPVTVDTTAAADRLGALADRASLVGLDFAPRCQVHPAAAMHGPDGEPATHQVSTRCPGCGHTPLTVVGPRCLAWLSITAPLGVVDCEVCGVQYRTHQVAAKAL